jgi:branched-chain amino acid aminotransferase
MFIANEDQRARGLRMVVSERPRIAKESVDPTIKNYHWMDLTAALFEAYDQDAETAVLSDGNGNLTEGPGFNVFVIKNGAAATPDSGVLEGITRRTAMDLFELEGIPCVARIVRIDELRDADEIFITSTGGGLMPVSQIDGKPVGIGRPGPITSKLSKLYWSKQEAGWHSTAVDYDAP